MNCRVLFIDDERNPHDSASIRENYPKNSEFHVIRQLHEMVTWIADNGAPDIASFDFHLHTTDNLRNGADYAAFMAFLLTEQDSPMPYIMVHSSDPAAEKKIFREIGHVIQDFSDSMNDAKKANLSF